MLPITARTELCQGLAAALSRLRAAVANHIARARHLEALLALIYNRITRMLLRLDRLALRWQAGTLPKPRPRHPRPAASETAASETTASETTALRPPTVPKSRAWLIRLVQPAAQSISHVEIFLANPQTRALVEAAPQAGRILRPLCRALGIELPAWLRLPERLGPPPPPRPKPRAPKPEPLARPLPAYVKAAVRAWKRRYG